MTTESISDRANDARINDLYWNSTRTVEDILTELGVSRHTLYASVDPLPAQADCFACGGALVFSNRTNRGSGTATCEACGLDTELDPGDGDGLGRSPSFGQMPFDRWRSDLAEVEPRRMALVGGAAALGIMAGAVAVRTLRN